MSEEVVESFHLVGEDGQLKHSCSTVGCAQAALVARAVVALGPGVVRFVPGTITALSKLPYLAARHHRSDDIALDETKIITNPRR